MCGENEELRDQLRSAQERAEAAGATALEFDFDLQRILETPTAQLELSVRLGHCLAAANIKTVRELVQWKEKEMKAIKNLGRKSFKEVLEVLTELHPKLHLGMRIPD